MRPTATNFASRRARYDVVGGNGWWPDEGNVDGPGHDDRGDDELAETGKARHRVDRIAPEAVHSVGAKRPYEGGEAAKPSARGQEMHGAVTALKDSPENLSAWRHVRRVRGWQGAAPR